MTCGSEGTRFIVSTHSTQQKYVSVNIYSCKGDGLSLRRESCEMWTTITQDQPAI